MARAKTDETAASGANPTPKSLATPAVLTDKDIAPQRSHHEND